ncbi:hypothetical protein N2152v2_008541 [Parachlorella kessleri]
MAKKTSAAKANLQPTESTGRGKQRKAEEVADGLKVAGNKKQKKEVQQQQQRPAAETLEQPSASARAVGPHNTGKKGGSEIDELFGQLRKKQEGQPALEGGEEQRQRPKREASSKTEAGAAAPRIAGSKDDIFGTETGKARKRTEEGYAIYSEDELGLQRKDAGNTPLCPFDCDCCY